MQEDKGGNAWGCGRSPTGGKAEREKKNPATEKHLQKEKESSERPPKKETKKDNPPRWLKNIR